MEQEIPMGQETPPGAPLAGEQHPSARLPGLRTLAAAWRGLAHGLGAVSYTHLTLPTICSV